VELVSPELVLVAPPELRRLALEQLETPVFSAAPIRERPSGWTIGAAVFALLAVANGVGPLLLMLASRH
jgi:hypothetical protein